MQKISLVAAAFAALCGSALLHAASNDYSDPKTWLCRPGIANNACEIDLTTTVISPDAKLTVEKFTAAANAPVDCFYVYPTVSTDRSPNSDMNPDPAELNVIKQQFARFGSECRRFAPMYRQVTIAGLMSVLSKPGAVSLDTGMAYDDVLDAWRYYLEHDNQGRGFVLIGHSQGSAILQRLIREEIDGKPVEARMISAIIPGFTFNVPAGKETGGAFQHIPLCKSATQTGCVIVYSSFRSTTPPPANTLFGKAQGEGMTAACVDPSALAGTKDMHAYLAASGQTITAAYAPKQPWTTPEQKIDTPFVSLPGLITSRCTSNENATYLEVTVHPDPAGKRAGDFSGDLVMGPNVAANWGLHLVDVNLAMGDLVQIVGRESKAYLAKRK